MTLGSSSEVSSTHTKARPYIGWRLLSMLYDALPVIALWFLVSAFFTVGYSLAVGNDRQNIQPFSLLSWLLWICCWLITGLYVVLSWKKGGQTLGMRPWRLRIVAANTDATKLTTKQLWIRYAVATGSFACAGLGFWWAWLDRDRLTWHDRACQTRVIRVAKRK